MENAHKICKRRTQRGIAEGVRASTASAGAYLQWGEAFVENEGKDKAGEDREPPVLERILCLVVSALPRLDAGDEPADQC